MEVAVQASFRNTGPAERPLQPVLIPEPVTFTQMNQAEFEWLPFIDVADRGTVCTKRSGEQTPRPLSC
jgi:hypothetical protein